MTVMKIYEKKFVKWISFFLACGIFFGACSTDKKTGPVSDYIFGTVCTVNLFEDGTKENYEKIFSRLRKIDDTFSVKKSTSQISLINQNAGRQSVTVSQEVFDLLKICVDAYGRTDGSFNPALGSLINLWAIGTDREKVPAASEIENAKSHCNPKDIFFVEETDAEGKKIFLCGINDPLTQIDLGGVVKGYAADEIVKMLKNYSIKKAVINLGGNVYVFGKKNENAPEEKWNVGIKNPFDPNSEPIKIVALDESSVVTSGAYERFFISGGKKYHHIIDPKTGFPSESGIASVTIISRSSCLCDILSTAYFVAGNDCNYKEKFSGEEIKVIFILNDGEIVEN